MRDCRQDCRQKNGLMQKCTIFSRKTAKTALYHLIKCGNLAESQGFEEPFYRFYELISCYYVYFTLLSLSFRTIRRILFLLCHSVKGIKKGTKRHCLRAEVLHGYAARIFIFCLYHHCLQSLYHFATSCLLLVQKQFSAQIYFSFSTKSSLTDVCAQIAKTAALKGLYSSAGGFHYSTSSCHSIVHDRCKMIPCYFPCLICNDENSTTFGGASVPTGKSSKYSTSSGLILKS